MLKNNKSLGQHWLKDGGILSDIANAVEISSSDTVLEIGPGLGTLTSKLLRRAGKVVAVEFDSELARKLPGQFPGKNLEVHNEDILQFNLDSLPEGYIVVANVPYYITSKIVDKLVSAKNKPRASVLLVQKEVAERIAAQPGDMSLLALNAQIYSVATLGIKVPREYFTPPPKVDSQVVVLTTVSESLVSETDQKNFWRVARAGFSAKRKKLRSSISAGLAIDKSTTEKILTDAFISPDSRAEDLSIDDWLRLSRLI